MRANKTLEHQLAEHRAEVAELKKQNMTGCSSPAALPKTKTSTLKAAELEYKMGTKMSNRTKEMAENCRLNGNRCFGKGQFDESIDWYTKSLEYEKSSATFANRAQAHIVCNRPAKAILDARAALALDPKHLKARFRLGRAIYLRGAVDALVELEKCRNADPNNEQIRQEIDACQKVLNISPSSPNDSSTEQHSATGQSPAEIKPPHFSFTLLLVRLWLKQILLVDREGNVRHFTKLDQLKPVLLSESDGPIAQIRLEECTVDQPLIGFFRALDPKLLAGGSLELFGLVATEQQFAQFIELFRPISIHFAAYAEYPVLLYFIFTF
uniref:TPR_REGION domain-containing protein n=1 Tax=Globodera pallida TaxID=36090 RepID=A0A183CHI0_GLOPA